MHLTISLVQMDVVIGQPEVNLVRVRNWVRQAAESFGYPFDPSTTLRAGFAQGRAQDRPFDYAQDRPSSRALRPAQGGAQTEGRSGRSLVVLPELWGSGYDLAHAAQHADELGTGLFAEMAALARIRGVYLAGSLLERRSGGFFNTAVLYGPGGDLLGHYSKVHLFRLMDEPQYLQAGDAMPVFDLPWGRTALAVCYDLRFPEIFRHYALENVVLVVIPAQWPAPRVEHWRTLLRSRAIENQMIVVGCNRVGRDGDDSEPFGGYSAIYDAWGQVVVEGKGNEETMLTGAVDLSTVAQARSFIPVFEDRRPDLYG